MRLVKNLVFCGLMCTTVQAAQVPTSFEGIVRSDGATLRRIPSGDLRALVGKRARPNNKISTIDSTHATSFMNHVRERECASSNSNVWDSTQEGLHRWFTGVQGYTYDASTQKYACAVPASEGPGTSEYCSALALRAQELENDIQIRDAAFARVRATSIVPSCISANLTAANGKKALGVLVVSYALYRGYRWWKSKTLKAL